MKTEYRYVDIPTETAHRLAIKVERHNPQYGGDAKLVLQRQKFGPIWIDLDTRTYEGYTKANGKKTAAWLAEMEHELVSEWFAEEIYELRK